MPNFLVDVLLPPASLAVLSFILLLLGRRPRRAATPLVFLLVLLGVPFVAAGLLNSLAPAPAKSGPAPSAIVILSADAVRTQDPGVVEPGPLSLDRIRAGAALQRRTGLPILVSGGMIPDTHVTLADMMATSLRDDFEVPVRWAEGVSQDTWQNAQFSAELLRRENISRVYLVTHVWHMRRALLAFRHFGMDPVPAPVRPAAPPPVSFRQGLISASAWFNSYIALHELVGLLFYSLRG